ncbi:MAG: family 10 glycosylhydrolase, partial [Ignavibacteriales bacterium]|nr:family 10 glycosylhydrolase [Ignavibacteriales bacterium]
MKKILPVFCLLASVVFAQVKHELRGVWVTNVASNVLSTDKNIADAMKLLAQKGFNVVFPVVWNKGYTLYPSQVMNTHFGIPIDPVYGTRDPLDKIVIEAHRNGMEIMPWFEYGFSPGYWGGGTPVDSGFILQKYPAWGAADNTGALLIKNGFIWMSGINPEVQNFMLSLMTEVLDKYDVDGVQGDDRLPAMPIEGGYDEAAKTIYRAENNGTNPPSDYQNNNWKKWRANKLNRFLSRVRDSVKARGQNIILSVAPNPYPWGYDNYLQDAKTWVDS